MQPPSPANPYHAVVRRGHVFHGADGKTALKVYYVDIIGRQDPSLTEWARCGFTVADFVERLDATPGIEGVGFIIAFPHITKVFRFGPETEIVMNVRAWNTRPLADLNLARSDGYVEFACLAEAAIAAEEFEFWRAADSVAAYLARWSVYTGGAIADKDKLRRYWGSTA